MKRIFVLTLLFFLLLNMKGQSFIRNDISYIVEEMCPIEIRNSKCFNTVLIIDYRSVIIEIIYSEKTYYGNCGSYFPEEWFINLVYDDEITVRRELYSSMPYINRLTPSALKKLKMYYKSHKY